MLNAVEVSNQWDTVYGQLLMRWTAMSSRQLYDEARAGMSWWCHLCQSLQPDIVSLVLPEVLPLERDQ